MKKIILSTTLLAVLALASCGKSDICSCAETAVSMMKEAKEVGWDPTKIGAIQTKYKTEAEKCDKLNAGLSEAETIAMETEMKGCDSYKEMEKLQKEMMGQ